LIGVVPDDPRPLHRAALADADALVRRVGPKELGRPTPCADWTLADLLAHMIGQHLGFATAVREGSAPADAYAPRPWTVDLWAHSSATLVEAFAEADLDGEAVLVEIAAAPLPMAFVVRAQLLDTVVHAWDVARALGVPYVPSAELVAAVADGAAAVPDDGRRTRPGAAFAPARPVQGSEWERALAQLGRDPRAGLT
jgi:uncharacterized protein (TIGR03086 family)